MQVNLTWDFFLPASYDSQTLYHPNKEMFAYCLAAAHLKLPHQVAKGFMVSDVGSFHQEGWNMLDQYSNRDVCTPGKIPNDHLPHILHYCQRYILGKYVIGKHRVPEDFLSCEQRLLGEPPEDIGEKFNFGIEPDRAVDSKFRIPPKTVKNHAFMLCNLIPYLNEAATYWKDNHCAGKIPNKQKSLTFYKDMNVAPHLFQS